jgi:hypothetical protein
MPGRPCRIMDVDVFAWLDAHLTSMKQSGLVVSFVRWRLVGGEFATSTSPTGQTFSKCGYYCTDIFSLSLYSCKTTNKQLSSE